MKSSVNLGFNYGCDDGHKSNSLQVTGLAEKPREINPLDLPKRDYTCQVCRKLIRKNQWHKHLATPRRISQGHRARLDHIRMRSRGLYEQKREEKRLASSREEVTDSERCNGSTLSPLPKLLPGRDMNIELTWEIRRLREGWKAQ